MMTEQIAKEFAHKWIVAWNSHKIENILEHYAEDIEFTSPIILLLKFNEEGVIKNKADLKRYFEMGLKAYPDLHFKFHKYFSGINTVVIYYTSVSSRMVAEVFELSTDDKAVKVSCNYTSESSRNDS